MLIVVGAVGMVAMAIRFHVWQDRVRDLMGVKHLKWYDYPLAAGLSLVVLFALSSRSASSSAGWSASWSASRSHCAVPRVSASIVVVLLVALTIALLNGVVVKFAMRTMNNTFASVNNEMNPDTAAPKTPLRSGGPQSLVSWDSLGHQGRIFIEGGPTVDQLTAFNGAPATEPIRAYAGLNSADGITATAELAARELQRDGRTAARRRRGRNDHRHRLDQRGGGRRAGVHVQRQHRDREHAVLVPAQLAVVPGGQGERPARRPGAVRGRRQAGPPAARGQRPKLVVFGESLGSFGGEAPFMSLNNVLARTDGALFCGPTFNNTIWTDLTATRDAGSPEWLPIYDDGQNVRFVARPSDLERPDAAWDHPRVVYLQHASDPIAWWNPDLLFARPDWLREKRGYDVLPRDRVDPGGDVPAGLGRHGGRPDVPPGHGHDYVADVADGWAAVLPPPGWTPEKTAKLRPLLHASDG